MLVCTIIKFLLSDSLIKYLEHHFQPLLAGIDPIIQVSLFMVVSLHVILNTTHRGSYFMLGILGYIIKMCFARINPHLSQHDRKVLSDLPRDPDNVEKKFNLEAKAVIHIPALHCTGPSDSRNEYSVSDHPSSRGPANP